MLFINSVEDIREQFAALYQDGEFVTDKFGGKVIEIIGASFIADQELIFGAVNEDYVERELEWYESQSLYVNDIPGGAPKIWKEVACKNGRINSNYGWCVWNAANGKQLDQAVAELKKNPQSRRAVMIYTRPTMWQDYNENGRSDFMCTNAVQYVIRNRRVHAIVQMRSNDAWAGYRNDYAWQKHVLNIISDEVKVKAGDIHWNAGSLHVYDRQFYMIDHYIKTGELSITKEKYDELYKVA